MRQTVKCKMVQPQLKISMEIEKKGNKEENRENRERKESAVQV